MEITATLKHGSFTFEIQGGSREDVQEEILGLAEFIKENEDDLNELTGQIHRENPENDKKPIQTPATDWEGSASSPNMDTSCFVSISQRTRVDEEVLAQLFEVPDDEDEPPFLNLYQFETEAEVLGKHRNQQQSLGSVLLLYLWQECRSVEEIEFEKLDKVLSYSDIEIERRNSMNQAFGGDAQKWFNSDGGKIQLTTPGEHHARQLISELAEEFQS